MWRLEVEGMGVGKVGMNISVYKMPAYIWSLPYTCTYTSQTWKSIIRLIPVW